MVRDTLWFYAGYSRMVNERLKAGTYFNTDLADVAAGVRYQPTGDGARKDPRLERPPHLAGGRQAQGRRSTTRTTGSASART